MSRLIKNSNIALFEYPHGAENPKFSLDEKNILWIEGYSVQLMGSPIRSMKRYDFSSELDGYKVLGRYEDVKSKIKIDLTDVLNEYDVDAENCLVLIKK